jgi:hypothetical protein
MWNAQDAEARYSSAASAIAVVIRDSQSQIVDLIDHSGTFLYKVPIQIGYRNNVWQEEWTHFAETLVLRVFFSQ